MIREFTGEIEERDSIEALIYNIMDLNAQDTLITTNQSYHQDVDLFNNDDRDEHKIIKYYNDTVIRFNNNSMILINTN